MGGKRTKCDEDKAVFEDKVRKVETAPKPDADEEKG